MTKAQEAYRRAALKRQQAVLRDARRTELAIVAEQDVCFGLIMDDYRRGHTSGGTITRRLQAFAAAVQNIIGDALALGAHDWWRSAVELWADAAVEEPRLMAAIALSPRRSLAESKARDRASAAFALLDILTPPSMREVLEIINAPVNGLTWRERLSGMTSRRVSQRGIANAVAEAYAAGGNIDDVTRAVRPLVHESSTAARRIARTESLRVANEMHERSMDEAGDIVIGHTYTATLDAVTRPEHAARHGRVVKKPGYRIALPDGPNCRCEWIPIFDHDVKIFGRPGTLPPEASKVEAFAGWFDQQPRHRRVAVVGTDAYARAQTKFGVQDPTWEQVTAASPSIETERIRGTLEEKQTAAREARRASRRMEAA